MQQPQWASSGVKQLPDGVGHWQPHCNYQVCRCHDRLGCEPGIDAGWPHVSLLLRFFKRSRCEVLGHGHSFRGGSQKVAATEICQAGPKHRAMLVESSL